MIFKIIYNKTTPKGHLEDARVHCVVLKVRAVPLPATSTSRQQEKAQRFSCRITPTPGPSGPNSVHVPTDTPRTLPTASGVLSPGNPDRHLVKCSTHELTGRHERPDPAPGHPEECQMLLRKEVIQPHLPVRLPCYDLVLITDPTFDGSLHKGWATGFRCYRLS